MIQTQRNKYLETSVQTATPAQLLIMLYDGAIRFCRAAVDAIHRKNFEEANSHFLRTQDIISEFTITLDRTTPVAEGLLQLYEYFNHRLVEANIQKNAEPAEEVLAHLAELRETWVQAAKTSQASVKHG